MANTPSPIRLLIVDDDEELRDLLARHFQRHGMSVAVAGSGEEALRSSTPACHVALLDLHLPGISGIELLTRLKERQPALEAIVLTAQGSIETAIEAMRQGAYDYLTKPFQLADLEVRVQKAYEKSQLFRRERQWVEQVRSEEARYRLVGSGPAMRKVLQLIARVAPTEATVLVRGASGTGKELVARAIHGNSPRADRPMVTINCATLQENLLESELFGHEKGAFTGAVQNKAGLIEVAEGGTLFIDEVAEMSPSLQAKLLRVLEDGHYRRVGSTVESHADVRVIAATNKSLEEEIRAGRFREDLYYRLNVLTIPLPPLTERTEDIPELVAHFLATRPVAKVRCTIEPEVLQALQRYSWPGNIRELANVIERAQILSREGKIALEDLPENFVSAEAGDKGPPSGDPRHIEEVERRHVWAILQQEKGNKVRAARALGISRRALYRLIARHHLDPDRLNLPGERGA